MRSLQRRWLALHTLHLWMKPPGRSANTADARGRIDKRALGARPHCTFGRCSATSPAANRITAVRAVAASASPRLVVVWLLEKRTEGVRNKGWSDAPGLQTRQDPKTCPRMTDRRTCTSQDSLRRAMPRCLEQIWPTHGQPRRRGLQTCNIRLVLGPAHRPAPIREQQRGVVCTCVCV